MAIYFLLGTLSNEGQQMLHTNPDLISNTAASLEVEGARILGQYAVLGRYDYIIMVLANENEAVARMSQELGVRTGLRFETLAGVAVGFLADNDPADEPVQDTSVSRQSGRASDG